MSSLYLEYFRLGEAPFGITPNGKFFFEGQARGAILDALHHAVLDEDGIVVVVGEVGSGKTMLCRMLAERLPGDQVDLVYLANPSFGPREILQSLIADWGLQPPAEGQPLVLTSHEFKILSLLMQRPGEVLSRTTLSEHLYPQDSERDSNTIEVFVGRLRKKLPPGSIETVRGLGYRLQPAPEVCP